MRINESIEALNAYRSLSIVDAAPRESLGKLPSDVRMNQAADDAGRSAKSDCLRAEIRGKRQAIRIGEVGIRVAQIAEDALDEVFPILQRVRELAISAAGVATTDGSAHQAEITMLLAEADAIGSACTRVAENAAFADHTVVGSDLTFHLDAHSGNEIQMATDFAFGQADGFGVDLRNVDAATDADTAIATIDGAIDSVATKRSTVGDTRNRMEQFIADLGAAVENLSAAESRVREPDLALEIASCTLDHIGTQAGATRAPQANRVPAFGPLQAAGGR